MKSLLMLVPVLAAACLVIAVPASAGIPCYPFPACLNVGTSAPEPATLALLAAGIGGVALLRKARQKP